MAVSSEFSPNSSKDHREKELFLCVPCVLLRPQSISVHPHLHISECSGQERKFNRAKERSLWALSLSHFVQNLCDPCVLSRRNTCGFFPKIRVHPCLSMVAVSPSLPVIGRRFSSDTGSHRRRPRVWLRSGKSLHARFRDNAHEAGALW